jgi:hypothetical protein
MRFEQTPKSQLPNPRQIPINEIPNKVRRDWFEFWSLRFTWVLELGFWDFFADLRLSFAAAKFSHL